MDIKNIRDKLANKYNRLSEELNEIIEKEEFQSFDNERINSIYAYRYGIWHAIQIIDKECKKI